ncbi:MAG: hypothetical protein ACFE9S_15705 [Candidatus Hermodarchaeota archaeon]
MGGIQKKIPITAAVISIISVFTPVIFHISPNYFYHFWLWGLTLFFGLTSNEIGVTYNLDVGFLIPGIISSIVFLISSIIVIFSLIKEKRGQQIKLKYYYTGTIIMIVTPLFLIIGWQIFYVVVIGYSTFWGGNTYWPNFSLFLQFIAGMLYLVSIKKTRTKKENNLEI